MDTYQLIPYPTYLDRVVCDTKRGRAAAKLTPMDIPRDSTATNRTPRQRIQINLWNSP
jgi:hypothetical protein